MYFSVPCIIKKIKVGKLVVKVFQSCITSEQENFGLNFTPLRPRHLFHSCGIYGNISDKTSA